MDNLSLNWQKTLNLFQKKFENIIDKVEYDSYFSSLQAKKATNTDLYVTCDTQWAFEFVNDYAKDLEDVFNTITGLNLHLDLSSEDQFNNKFNQIAENNLSKEEVGYNDHLNYEMTFDNFVIGQCNRIAQNASLAVAMKPGVAYSPLFIHSKSGLGKTHLLNAIGNYAKKKNSDINVLYITSEDFVEEYVTSIKQGDMENFKNLYRNVDILLIDDIQFIAAKEASSEMFFNIFNNLIRHKKQIVITSDKPPRELKGMENRLVSRFASGLTVSIDTPTFETSKAIILKKLENKNVDFPISEEVIDFIASHFNNDVRDLDGSINRLLFYKLIRGTDVEVIDLNFALEAFNEDLDTHGTNNNLSVETIKKAVANYYNLTVSQINSKSRTANITVARHIAMYLVRELIPDISYIQIGNEFGGRDHSTVMKACDKVTDKLKKDENYKTALEKIKSKLS